MTRPPASSAADQAPLTGRGFLIIALAFFGVVVVVNIGLAVAASFTFPGVVVDNSYTASQGYNALLAAAQKQDATGTVAILGTDGDRLIVSLTGRALEAASRLQISAHVGRPSTARQDRVLSFTRLSDRYRANDALANGLWDVEIEVTDGEALLFRRSERITIDGGRNG